MSHILRRRRLKRVIVTLKSGSSFSGVLWQHDGDALVLRQSTALNVAPEQSEVGVDGELILLRSEIDYVQRP